MEMSEFGVEVGHRVPVLAQEHKECSLVRNAAPFQVLHTSTFVQQHEKRHDYL